MFPLFRHQQRMRFFRGDGNDFENINPRDFPEFFAICIGINPRPQFQLLRIQRTRGYDEYAEYRLTNKPFEATDWFVLHQGNPEDVRYGQMFLSPPNPNIGHREMRIRFEIRPIVLASQEAKYPIVMFDDIRILPNPNVTIVPRNARPITNPNYNYMDPHFIMNYLMDRQNFFIEDTNSFHRAMRFMERRHEMGRHHRSWYDSDHDYIRSETPPRYDEDYYFEAHRPAPAAAGGAGSIRRIRRNEERRRSIPQTPPTTQVTPAPQTIRPVQLQAFTIQALINHAVSENMTCPISMNPIAKASACVLSCQHVFERDSITHWLSDHENCPVCRQTSAICN